MATIVHGFGYHLLLLAVSIAGHTADAAGSGFSSSPPFASVTDCLGGGQPAIMPPVVHYFRPVAQLRCFTNPHPGAAALPARRSIR